MSPPQRCPHPLEPRFGSPVSVTPGQRAGNWEQGVLSHCLAAVRAAKAVPGGISSIWGFWGAATHWGGAAESGIPT